MAHPFSFESRELVVLDDQRTSTPFAAKGDSGAAVRDGRGTMLGMLWGGIVPGPCDRRESNRAQPIVLSQPDRWALNLSGITLVTPMEALLTGMQNEMESAFPGVPVTLHALPMSSGPGV
jgi:hypothetical protein